MNAEHRLYDPATSRLGSELSKRDQNYVLSAYVHRYTATHVPAWARLPRPDGTPYPVQFASDGEWLAFTRFAVTMHGDLDKRATHCLSSPTWPDNPELRRAVA